MANATWREATNECLLMASLDPFVSDADFNADLGDKYQIFAKRAVKLANSVLGTRCHRHFSERKIPLITSAGVSTYPLDTGISPESIHVRSFFNQTTDPVLKQYNGELRNIEYTEFLKKWPDQSLIPEGSPTHWIMVPIERTEVSTAHKIQIFPTPNATYTLQFQAKLNPYVLTQASDPILYPPEYQHALTMFAWALLEEDLGEGKGAIPASLAKKTADEVLLVAGSPRDVRNAPRTMRLPGMKFGRRTYYNSPQSVDAETGAVMD